MNGKIGSAPTIQMAEFSEEGRPTSGEGELFILPLGGRYPDKAAVPKARLIVHLFGNANGIEEGLQDHLFEFITDLGGGRGCCSGG